MLRDVDVDGAISVTRLLPEFSVRVSVGVSHSQVTALLKFTPSHGAS